MDVSAMEKLKKAVAIGTHAMEATTAKRLTRTTPPTTAGESKPSNCNNNENERQRRIKDEKLQPWYPTPKNVEEMPSHCKQQRWRGVYR
jgi:hypothetical protein